MADKNRFKKRFAALLAWVRAHWLVSAVATGVVLLVLVGATGALLGGSKDDPQTRPDDTETSQSTGPESGSGGGQTTQTPGGTGQPATSDPGSSSSGTSSAPRGSVSATPSKSTTPSSPATPATQTNNPTTAPVTPTSPASTQTPASNLRATSVGMRAVTFNFNPGTDSDGVAYYKVVRTDGYPLATTTVTTFTDDWVFPGSNYTYTVQVVDVLGDVNPVSAPLSVTTPADTIAPTTPTNFEMYNQDAGKAYFRWTDSTDNSAVPNIDLEYEISVSPEPPFAWTSGRYATVYTEPGVTYTITVRASDFPGNLSPPTAPITFTGL